MKVISQKTLATVDRAIEELCHDSEKERGHLPTINGLIACAMLVQLGHPIALHKKARLYHALVGESFKSVACELLGPP